jgi:hypothetical protein
MATILASSINNEISIATPSVQLPFVLFSIGTLSANIEIEIKDKNNDYGYSKIIVGKQGGETTDSSFNTQGIAVYSLYECLKLNSIFYNITINGSTIKCYIDTSLSYTITMKTGSGITIGGTFRSYQVKLPNKTTLILQSGDTSIDMEKYVIGTTTKFNVTAPFEHMTFYAPKTYNLVGYNVIDGKTTAISLPYSTFTVLPTTCTEDDNPRFGYYRWEWDGRISCMPLTKNRNERYYNYDEDVTFSFLTSISDTYAIRVKLYTNTGVFIGSHSNRDGMMHPEVYDFVQGGFKENGIRRDALFWLGLDSIERYYNKQVGYFTVEAETSRRKQVTTPIKFYVNPSCNENHELYWLNEYGGVDSFNFNRLETIDRGIGNLTTYSNYLSGERVLSKTNKITYKLTSRKISKNIAEWLNGLVRSKYVFVKGNPNNIIIIDKFDISTNSDDDEYEVTIEYHNQFQNKQI